MTTLAHVGEAAWNLRWLLLTLGATTGLAVILDRALQAFDDALCRANQPWSDQ